MFPWRGEIEKKGASAETACREREDGGEARSVFGRLVVAYIEGKVEGGIC